MIKGTGRVPEVADPVPFLLQQTEREGSCVAYHQGRAFTQKQGTVPKHKCPEPAEMPTGDGRAGVGAIGDLCSAGALHTKH